MVEIPSFFGLIYILSYWSLFPAMFLQRIIQDDLTDLGTVISLFRTIGQGHVVTD